MFIWAVLAALAMTASAQVPVNCAKKTTGKVPPLNDFVQERIKILVELEKSVKNSECSSDLLWRAFWAGVTSSKSLLFVGPVLVDGQCNLKVDLSSDNKYDNNGIYVSLCDNDAIPLVVINDDRQFIDIKRQGNCRGEIRGIVQVSRDECQPCGAHSNEEALKI